jgi:hypothetical protein
MNWKRIFNGLFLLAGVVLGVLLSIQPWRVYFDQRKLADERIQQMKTAEASRVRLLERKSRMESASGREQIARDYGYKRQGEQPIETPGSTEQD